MFKKDDLESPYRTIREALVSSLAIGFVAALIVGWLTFEKFSWAPLMIIWAGGSSLLFLASFKNTRFYCFYILTVPNVAGFWGFIAFAAAKVVLRISDIIILTTIGIIFGLAASVLFVFGTYKNPKFLKAVGFDHRLNEPNNPKK